jgi:hypothetical protein
MRPSRHCAIASLVLTATAAGLVGCGGTPTPPAPPPPINPIHRALDRAAHFLIQQQDKDGAWRSDLYGTLKDGPSLTPLVLRSLVCADVYLDQTSFDRSARKKGLDYLAAMARPDGTIDEGPHVLSQPVYTAALTVSVLSLEGDKYRAARDAWLMYLRERQLTEALGWVPADKEYGGWGYCAIIPRKPPPGEGGPPLLESNLSATRFALDALYAANCHADDPAFRAARVFVERCQNYADDPARQDPAFDDGGFHFIYDDPVRNKAGAAGKDRFGRQRFTSYGSATADGLVCFHALESADAPRATAARRWLETRFDVATHPGDYAADREANRNAVYYYCQSVAAALGGGPHLREIDTPAGKVNWANVLAGELIKRQRKDGSWVNDVIAQRENDPLVATAEAMVALAVCRLMQSP